MPLYVLCLEGGAIFMYKLEVELKSQKHPSEYRVSPLHNGTSGDKTKLKMDWFGDIM